MKIARRVAEEENLKLPEEKKKSFDELREIEVQPYYSPEEKLMPLVPRRVTRYIVKESRKLEIDRARQAAAMQKSDKPKMVGIGEGPGDDDPDAVDSLDEAEGEEEIRMKSYRFWLQYDLHRSSNMKIRTQEILKKDDMIANDFLLTINDYHAKIRGRTTALRNMISLS